MRFTALACLGALLFAVPAYAQSPGELTFWQSVKDSKNPAELQAYLQAYPNGVFAALARIRIKELGGNPGPAAQGPAPPRTAPPAPPSTGTPAAQSETPAATQVQWHEFHSPEGRFSVLFPGEPKLATNPPDANGHSEHRFAVEQNNAAFMVAYDDYAPGHVSPGNAEAVLPTAQQALLKAMGGTLREEKPVTLGGLPGRQVLFDTAEHNVGRVQIYVGQNRLYQIWYMGPATQASAPAVDRFFDSFKIGAAENAQSGQPPASAPSGAEAAPSGPSAPASAEANWHEFSPPNGGFSVELPGEAKAEITPPKPNGRAESRYVVDQGDTAFVVAVDDYPPGHLTHANPKTLLDAAQNAVLNGLHGTLREQRPVTIAGYPGREILFDTPDHNTGKVRVYVVRNRLYQTWYLGPTGQETRPAVDRFLNSFKLTS